MQTEINTTMKNILEKIKSFLGLKPHKNNDDDSDALKKGAEGRLINDIAGYIEKCKDYDGPLHAKAFRALYIYKWCLEKNGKDEKYISESISIKSDGSLAWNHETDLKEEFSKLKTTFEKNKILEKMEEDFKFREGVEESWKFISALKKDGGDKIYLDHFKTLFELSAEDGEISLSELLHIRGLMRKYISDREGNAKKEDEIEKYFKEGEEAIDKNKRVITRWFLKDLIVLAYADGKCDRNEYKKLKKLSDKYKVAEDDFFGMLMDVDRISYTPVERLKKDYWKNELDPKWWNKILDIWFLPFSGIGKIIRACVTKNSSGRVVAAFIIVIVGIVVYMYSLNDNLWEAIIESTSSFFRSYGGFRGERREIAVAQKYVYYLFQMLTLLFVIGLTFFHFGKEVGNEVNQKKAIYNITSCKWTRLFGWKWIVKRLLCCLVILVPIVALTVGFWLSCGGIPQPIKVGEVSIVKDRTNIVTDVGMSIEGSGVFTNRLGHSEIVIECNTNRFIASIINTEKVENKEIIFPNKLWGLLNEICYGINLYYAKLRFFVVNILFDACTYIDLWNNVCNFCDDVWNFCYEFMVRPYYLPILKRYHFCSFVISLLLWYLALSSIYVLYRIGVYAINFVVFLFKLNFCNNHKLYVIWGGVSNGELCDETIALMADIRRIKGGYVLVMLDKDSIGKERYDGITDYLREFDVCWKYVSYGRLNKYDGYGDYHFFIDKEGRKNRVMAQSVIDRLKKDNEDRFLVMRTKKPQLHVLVKHSTEHDLSNWLNNPVVRDVVDLRIFNVAEIVSDDLFQQVDCSPKSKNEIKILFLGMGRNSRAIMRKMFLIPRFVGKEMDITICESKKENRWRSLLYLLDILVVWNKVLKIEIKELIIINDDSKDNKSVEVIKKGLPIEVLKRLNKCTDFYKEDKYVPLKLVFEMDNENWTFIFHDGDVMSSRFKVWAFNGMFNFDNKDFKYDFVFSCLGDSHNSLTAMRRIERIYCRKTGEKGLPTDKYFMQLKDSRYASMYESKINGDISVFGDLRRVFSLIRIQGRYERDQLQEILESCNSNITSLRKKKSDLNDLLLNDLLLKEVLEDIKKFLKTSVGRIFIEYCYVYKRYCVLYSVKIHEVLLRIYCLLLIGDKNNAINKNNAIKSDSVTYNAQESGSVGQKSGTANPNAVIMDVQEEKGSVGQKSGTANPNAVIKKDVQEKGSVGQKSGTANLNAEIKKDVQESGSVGQKSGTANLNAEIKNAQKKGSVGPEPEANLSAKIKKDVQESGSVGPEPEANLSAKIKKDVQESGSGETIVILESPKDGGGEIVLSEKYDYCVFIMYCSIAGGNIIKELKVRQ